MERVFLFAALQFVASGYAIMRGGAPERIVGIALLVAAICTALFQGPLADRFIAVEFGPLIVDMALLAVLLAVALYADRFWPLWVAAFHALATGGHMVRGLDHGIEPMAYAILLASWSYPMLLLLVLGTLRHDLRGRRHDRELDWSGALPRFSRAV